MPGLDQPSPYRDDRQSTFAGAHSPALVITGMHRSGTSMTAQAFRAAGLFIGERLMPAHWSNPEGHFEDLDFYELSRAIIADNGFPDSGLLSDVRISVSSSRRAEAHSLIAERRALGTPWGWKDPRSVLLLDFWAELLPEAHFLFTFRAPWEVMDSLYQRGDPACQDDPMLALRAWVHYNRMIREFVRAEPTRSVVFEVSQVGGDTERCIREVASRMGVSLRVDVDAFRREHMSRLIGEAHVALAHALSPEAGRLYSEMCAMCGSDAALRVQPSERGLAIVLERCLAQWAHSYASAAARVQGD
jgi:hypothetical protein